MSLNSPKKFGYRQAQAFDQTKDHVQADIYLAAFNPFDLDRRETAITRELHRGKAFLFSQGGNSFTQLPLHSQEFGWRLWRSQLDLTPRLSGALLMG